MNNAKMWLVVKPTVGVPLFLTGVAVGSFAVHVAVLEVLRHLDRVAILLGGLVGRSPALEVTEGEDSQDQCRGREPALQSWTAGGKLDNPLARAVPVEAQDFFPRCVEEVGRKNGVALTSTRWPT